MVDLRKDNSLGDPDLNAHEYDWWAERMGLGTPLPPLSPAAAAPEVQPARAEPEPAVISSQVQPARVQREADDLIGPGPKERRWLRSIAVVLVAAAAGVLVTWWLRGAANALAAAGVALVLIVTGALAVAAYRWRPLARHSRLVSHLPLLGFLVSLALLVGGCFRTGWQLAGAALSATSASLQLPPLTEGSTVYDAQGKVVAVFHGQVTRQAVRLS
ncbi:MAG: hypothetical protein ACYCTI_11400, partial [Acidimicrobiales bacterium]